MLQDNQLEYIISIKNLSVFYGSNEAIHKINLDILKTGSPQSSVHQAVEKALLSAVSTG